MSRGRLRVKKGINKPQDGAIIVLPVGTKIVTPGATATLREPELQMKEMQGLVRACGLKVLESKSFSLGKPHPGLFLTKGRVMMLEGMVDEYAPGYIVFGCNLSPIQHRNLEARFGVCVIDRTRLILEIFARRAQSHEGRLQVALAGLVWQKSRLVKSWSHLERQRGGRGFMGGPGERQVEIDRRLIDQRIGRLKNALENVKKSRALQRRNRSWPLVALVGYTNAGKSTAFFSLSGAGERGRAQLFASLDTRLHKMRAGGTQQILIADTVGFVSALPTFLVEAFHATLEELRHADLILHIRDITAPDSQAQRQDVVGVIEQILPGLKPDVIEVWNKADLFSPSEYEEIKSRAKARGAVLISATQGEGIENLRKRVVGFFEEKKTIYEIILDRKDEKALSFLYRYGAVTGQEAFEDKVRLWARLSCEQAGRFFKKFEAHLLPAGNDFSAPPKTPKTLQSRPEYLIEFQQSKSAQRL